MIIDTKVMEIKDGSTVTGSHIVTFILCLLSNIFAGIVSTLLSVYLPVIVNEFSARFSPEQNANVTAIISALYILGWALGGLTWGYITDKIGRSRSLAIAVISYSIFTIVIGFAHSWQMIVAYRLLSGFAVGGLMVITPTLLSEIWPSRSRSIILGIDSIGFPIGIFSSGLVTYFVSQWRDAFLAGAIPLLLGILAIVLVKESGNWKTTTANQLTKVSLTTADTNNVIRGSIIFGSMLIGLWALFSWIPTWIQSILISSDGEKERPLAMIALGGFGLLGGFASGWVSNAIGVRKAMMMCFAGCFIMSVVLFATNASFNSFIYPEIGLLAVFFGMSQGLLSIYIPQLFPFSVRATATGFCFNAGRLLTAAAVFFVGSLVNVFGGYSNVLLAFSVIFMVGFGALWFSKERLI